MRSLFLFSVLLLSACGGNWSNADLAFANALPRRDDLKSRLPSSSSSQPLESVGTRRDGLVVGDPSGAWAQTRKAATDYNGLLDLVLGVVDQVRAVAPTTRTTDTRTWGPFADSNNPGREVQVVISRADEVNFAWGIESRPTNGEFIRILTGNFVATDTARRGRGTFTVHVKGFRDVVKIADQVKELDQIDVGYVTDLFPKRVEMLFQVKPGSTLGISSLGYTARAQEDGSGAMRFVYTLPGADVSELEINAAWKPTGEGRALGVVTRGTYTGFNITECWGKSFTVVHYAESWIGGVVSGPAGDCAVIDGL
jgi:hypothetical protein